MAQAEGCDGAGGRPRWHKLEAMAARARGHGSAAGVAVARAGGWGSAGWRPGQRR